jgi:phosphinothricin acetyltransferase
MQTVDLRKGWWSRIAFAGRRVEIMNDHVTIVDLESSHWPEVRRIYEAGLATGQASFETRAPEWEAWNASHLASPRLVAARGGAVAGWAALSPVSARRVYAGVAEVSVYVDATARGCGIGKRLLAELIRRSEAAQIWTLQASIFPENAASCALHVRCGFRLVGRRERIAQHHGVWRDTHVYERRSAVSGIGPRG